jgi:Glycosyl hydrolase family 65, N-terminal domain
VPDVAAGILPHVRMFGGRQRRIDLTGQFIEGKRRGHVTALVGIYRSPGDHLEIALAHTNGRGHSRAIPLQKPITGCWLPGVGSIKSAVPDKFVDLVGHKELDMRRGVLLTGCRFVDHPAIAVRVRTLHLLSLSERAIGVQVIELEIEDGEIELAVEGSFAGPGLGLRPERIEQDFGVWRTKYSGKRLAMAAASSLHIDGSALTPTMPRPFMWSWHWKTRLGQIVSVERLVVAVRGDLQDADPGRVAGEKLGVARQVGWRKVVQEHEAAWLERWHSSDIEIIGRPGRRAGAAFRCISP